MNTESLKAKQDVLAKEFSDILTKMQTFKKALEDGEVRLVHIKGQIDALESLIKENTPDEVVEEKPQESTENPAD